MNGIDRSPSLVTIVGLSGPSCSGKSTVAKELETSVGDTTVVQEDAFFIDPDLCSPYANFCDLGYVDVDAFLAAINNLAAGAAAEVPEVDWQTFRRVGDRLLEPASLVVVEGMTIFRIDAVTRVCNHRIYLAPPWSILEDRKRDRDARERGKSNDVISRQLEWMRWEYEADLRRFSDCGDTIEVIDPMSADVPAVLRRRLQATGCNPS